MKKRGFTLIELLVVISIIGLLSSIVLASLSTARARARDARRQSDMQNIFTALNLFYDKYGCLPVTADVSNCYTGYGDHDLGGWDYSSQGNGFLNFLVSSGIMSSVPVDPVNNTLDDGVTGYSYRYFCYTGGSPGLELDYWTEAGGRNFVRKTTSSPHDASFVCK